MRVRFNPEARAQLTLVRDYIRTHNPIAAQKFRREVERALRRLGGFPKLGHALPESPSAPYRQIIIGEYRFFYRVTDDVIWIVGVWHGAQLARLPR